MRTAKERLDDVRRLVDAALQVASDPALALDLVRTTGLSRQGVELALTEHLETSPTDQDLSLLVERAGTTGRVHVILSSNVFVGALRALAVARAAAPRVTVTPSHREPSFARALLDRARDPAISLEERIDVESVESGEIHVYGRAETLAAVRERARPGVRVRGHGPGLGVACVSAKRDLDVVARAIARDVVAFDQRGCLSPRAVLFYGSESAAAELSTELDRALSELEERVPRGHLHPEESAAATRYASTLAFAGRLWQGKAHAVGLARKGAPLVIPPPGRYVHVAVVDGVGEARALLGGMASLVVAIAADSPEITALVDHPTRVSALGQMQRPPLDGPVDLRG